MMESLHFPLPPTKLCISLHLEMRAGAYIAQIVLCSHSAFMHPFCDLPTGYEVGSNNNGTKQRQQSSCTCTPHGAW